MAKGIGKVGNYRNSLIVMFAALTLLFVYIANITEYLRITFYFISSVFVFGIVLEKRVGPAIVSFIVVAVIGFLIVPNKSGMLPYLFFFGHYGIFKYYIDEGMSGIAGMIVKLVYFNAGGALIYFFGGPFLFETLPFELAWWLMLIIAEVIFLLYDWLFTKVAMAYYSGVRNRLISGVRH